jgi:hypothetical protein
VSDVGLLHEGDWWRDLDGGQGLQSRPDAVLWANLPVTAVWPIGLLGIEFISIGPAFASLGWRVRKELPVQQGSPSRR